MNSSKRTASLAGLQAILDRVYSPYNGPAWTPKNFKGRSNRYLWSDAFGVCNYISLYYATDRDPVFLDQADALIRAVHDELGCVRDSKQRLGDATAASPTRGGLRIGKDNYADDGQYFHYLTKWMFALNRMAVARDDSRYNQWAVDLARVAHQQFVIRGLGGRPMRMVWKMSTDLQHVLVPSEGNLDPFDGLVTFRLLQHHNYQDPSVLANEIADMHALVEQKRNQFSTSDELDAGEALWLLSWYPEEPWAQALREASLPSIDRMFHSGRFQLSSQYRLMFREMGTVLGVKVATQAKEEPWASRVETLLRFWSDKLYDRDEDISPLMYASALWPGVWDPAFEY